MCTRSTFIVELPESIDLKQMRALMRELTPALKIDHLNLTFDCSRVQSVDSLGADLLLRCMIEVAKRDGSLELAKVSPATATVLELMGLDRLFTMIPNVEVSIPEQSERLATLDLVSSEAVPQPALA